MFLGLVEPIFVGLQCANDPFGLAALAPDRLADGLGNVPRPVAFGLNANLLDPLVGQRPQGGGGIAAPVVDHQRSRATPPAPVRASSTRPPPHESTSQRHTPHRGDSGHTAGQTPPFSLPCCAQSPAPASTPHARFCPWPPPWW